jgi:hypothetical protein
MDAFWTGSSAQNAAALERLGNGFGGHFGQLCSLRGVSGPRATRVAKKVQSVTGYWLETSRAVQSETLPPSVAHSGSA